MKIRWGNVVAVLVVLPAAVLVWKHMDTVTRFLASIGSIGPEHPREDQSRGLLALGVVVVAVAILVRLIRVAGHRSGS